MAATCFFAGTAQAQIEYSFDSGSHQGWSESNPIRGGDFGGELRLLESGGNPSGCLMAVDSQPGRGSLAAKAPSVLSGDLRRFEELRWDAWIPAGSTLSTSVLIEGKGQTLFRSASQRTPDEPTQDWFEKRADFNDAESWTRVRGDASFWEVVGNARALYIELDSTQGLGDEAKIDNVRTSKGEGDSGVDPESQLCPQHGFANFDPDELERVLTIGDSFSAGTGIYPRGVSYDEPRCLREVHSTPGAKLATEFRASSLNIACQNAKIAQVQRQADSLSFPDQGDGDLILVTAGGNDIRTRKNRNWGELIADCLVPGLRGCHKRKKNRIRNFDEVQESLVDLYQDLANRAPYAKIRVMGYPRLFQPSSRRCRSVFLISKREAAWLDGQSDELNRRIQSAVASVKRNTGADIAFVPVTSEFEGHGACGTDRYINRIRFSFQSGNPLRTGLHPNQSGYNAYHEALRAELVKCKTPVQDPKTGIDCSCLGRECYCSLSNLQCPVSKVDWSYSGESQHGFLLENDGPTVEIFLDGSCPSDADYYHTVSAKGVDTCGNSFSVWQNMRTDCSSGSSGGSGSGGGSGPQIGVMQ